AADRHPHDHRAGPRAVRTPADCRRLALQLLHCRPDVVEELYLRRGPKTAYCLPDSAPDDVRLRERRVVAAGDAERAQQAMRRAEHAALAFDVCEHGLARVGNVLSEDADALVLRHLLVQRALDGLAERDDIAAFGLARRRGDRG